MNSHAVAYLRCSTEEQARSGLGLEAQAVAVAAYCQLRGLSLSATYTDAGVSGGRPLAERPAGAALLTKVAVRDGPAHVVILRLDRAFRHAADALQTIEQWERRGVTLHIVDMGGNSINASTAAGKFVLTVLAGAAEMERNLTRERTRGALARKRAGGLRSGAIPYGHRLDPTDPDQQRLLPDVDQQRVIDQIVGMHAGGYSLRDIASSLNQQGIRAQRGNAWQPSAIHGILNRNRRAAAADRSSVGACDSRSIST